LSPDHRFMSVLIFVVDDDPDYRQLIEIHLSGWLTARVASFESGTAVLEHLDDEPDLVLLDVLMPELDGLETLRRIKARSPQTSVVMLSARSSMQIALAAIKLGALDYLIKGQDDFVKMDIIVGHIEERTHLREEILRLKHEMKPRDFQYLTGGNRDIMTLDDAKRMAVEHAYAICDGNILRTAKSLGVTRSTVYRLLRKFEIDTVEVQADSPGGKSESGARRT
ncbi:MAG: response regulator, partial [Rhodothermia bacterium]|nr:response regulator [Rhodothermia bacterium]